MTMKLIVALYRTVDFGADWLTANVENVQSWQGGAEFSDNTTLEQKLRIRFGPSAPRFKIWRTAKKATAGIEVMNFDVDDCDTPQAGLVMADPMDSREVSMVDGALRSELERLGIPMDAENIQWRIYYQTKGN
jgi:hypothetical protein